MQKKQTTLVYCEGQFGAADGKTAEGLVRHSEKYEILGVIDSHLSGKDSGDVLGLKANQIPIFKDLNQALGTLSSSVETFIFGKAPFSTEITNDERFVILEAISAGLNIVSGLHQFLGDDHELAQKALKNGVNILDVRKPPNVEDLHIYCGKISTVDIPIIAVLGTDCACGKMTTARELNQSLLDLGVDSVLIATGQTAMMQGSKYGLAIDAVPSQFVIGELEHLVVSAFENENPSMIIIEGQSSLGHEAFTSSMAILKGCDPDSVILQHPPGREYRVDFPSIEMPSLDSELYLIESISEADVIAITLSHENLTDESVEDYIHEYEDEYQIPVVDILRQGCEKVINKLNQRFPEVFEHIEINGNL